MATDTDTVDATLGGGLLLLAPLLNLSTNPVAAMNHANAVQAHYRAALERRVPRFESVMDATTPPDHVTVQHRNDAQVQFPRLIAEILLADGFTGQLVVGVAKSMGLTVHELEELVERACDAWDRTVPVTGAVPPAPPELEQKIATNTWDHISHFHDVYNAMRQGEWHWYANDRCKYVGLRVDMRTGHCIISDRDGARIDPKQLAYQYSSRSET